MALYWPAFDFIFRLDMDRLLPHLAAIEACHAAASTRIVPPAWQPQPVSADAESAIRRRATLPNLQLNEIQVAKLRLLVSNSSRPHAWVRRRFVPGSPPLVLADLLEMHRLVADEAGIRYQTRGEMRTEGRQVMVGTDGIGYHVGAPPSRLPELMDLYIRFITSPTLRRMHSAIHALIAHFFLTTIHPFQDGNGRVSRLVAAAVLYQRGYNGHGFYALSSHFYRNEERYHRILLKQQQDPTSDLTEFVAFGLEGFVLELQGIENFLKIKVRRHVKRPRPWPARHPLLARARFA